MINYTGRIPDAEFQYNKNTSLSIIYIPLAIARSPWQYSLYKNSTGAYNKKRHRKILDYTSIFIGSQKSHNRHIEIDTRIDPVYLNY